nr:putative ELM2 domain, homeodomain-like protein [Tanacetum cinerariifolium]
RYLQPRIQNRGNKAVVKFTVVDTSLCGGKIFETREMETRKFVLDHVSSELDSSDEEMDTNDHKPIKKQKTKYNATKEFIARLVPHVSEECENSLME